MAVDGFMDWISKKCPNVGTVGTAEIENMGAIQQQILAVKTLWIKAWLESGKLGAREEHNQKYGYNSPIKIGDKTRRATVPNEQI